MEDAAKSAAAPEAFRNGAQAELGLVELQEDIAQLKRAGRHAELRDMLSGLDKAEATVEKTEKAASRQERLAGHADIAKQYQEMTPGLRAAAKYLDMDPPEDAGRLQQAENDARYGQTGRSNALLDQVQSHLHAYSQQIGARLSQARDPLFDLQELARAMQGLDAKKGFKDQVLPKFGALSKTPGLVKLAEDIRRSKDDQAALLRVLLTAKALEKSLQAEAVRSSWHDRTKEAGVPGELEGLIDDYFNKLSH